MVAPVRISVLGLLVLSACAPDVDWATGDDLVAQPKSVSIHEGTPEGVAVLDFLNAESTTVDVLDYEVPMDARAAGNLIGHRDGGDDLWGTTDDDLFGSLDEVDAVRWVGPRTIERMVDFVADLGLIPSGTDELGTFDGVTFTVDEASATLELVNTASLDYLDYELGLDLRAVTSIDEAGEIESLATLAGLYYVGKSALTSLKEDANWDSGSIAN